MRTRTATLIGLFVAAYACSPDRLTTPAGDVIRLSGNRAAIEPPLSALEVAFGPEAFIRHSGQPDQYSRTIDLSHFEGPFILRVSNGDADGRNRVRSGELRVNDERILGQAEFAHFETELVRQYVNDISNLKVTLNGQPNTFLTIRIEGHPRRWRVCPGETVFRTYRTVQEAVTAADAGATIWVCDGIHDAAATVSKPLTIRSEHSGAATLRETNAPKPALLIDGVPNGTVRIADIGISVRQSAVIATGTWDKIEVDSVTFSGQTPTIGTSITTFTSTVAGARLEVLRSTFKGHVIGVFGTAAEVNVRNSTFEGVDRGVIYSFPASAPATGGTGRAENNHFTKCGLFGCIRILGRGGVTVAGNTLDLSTGTDIRQAIAISPGANTPQLPIILEDNEIIGGPRPSAATDFNAWPLRRGIQIQTNVLNQPSTVTVRRNRISNTGIGLDILGGNASNVQASDNVITNNFQAVSRNGNSAITFQRNNVLETIRYFGDFNSTASRDYKCNWWGSPTGPVNPNGAPPASIYTPWALQPIAGTTNPCPAPPLILAQVCSVTASGDPVTFPTVAAAYAAVETGGTIVVCDGTHSVRDVQISKSITIRAKGPGKPTLDALGARTNFYIRDVVGGPVLLQGLKLKGTWLVTSSSNDGYGANVNIEGSYSSITIEDSEFLPSGQDVAYEMPGPGQNALSYNSGVRMLNPTGNGITVRNNVFTGGDIGVGGSAANIRVEGNTFTKQSNGAVQIGGPGTSAVVSNNEVSQCGTAWCFAFFGASQVTVTGNRITVDMTRQTRRAIVVDVPVATVTGNSIRGTGGSKNSLDHTTWPIQNSGIAVHVTNVYQSALTSRAVVSRNTISGAFSAMDFAAFSSTFYLNAEARENIVSDVASPYTASATPGMVTLKVNRNDFNSYAFGNMGARFASVDARCNWWGQVSGPLASFFSTDPQTTFDPWATQPIAEHPEISCA